MGEGDAQLARCQPSCTLARGRHERPYALGAGLSDFGSKVAHLGVRYVVLAKTLDWQAFDWLHAQTDLRPTLDTPDLTVYEVTTRVDLGARISPDGTRGAAVTKRSPVRYDVPAGPPGQVELAEPYDARLAARRCPAGTHGARNDALPRRHRRHHGEGHPLADRAGRPSDTRIRE